MESIIKEINEAIEIRGISKAELSRRTDITQQTLLNFLKHGKNITVSKLIDICDALGLQINISLKY